MTRNKLLFGIIALCTIHSASAIVQSCATIAEVRKEIEHHRDKNIMIIFDIDNTIATTQNLAGSDQWFSHSIKHSIESGMSTEQALEIIVPLYTFAQRVVTLRPVEEETIAYIAALQKQGIKIVALTARNYELMTRTAQQLAMIDVDFSPANQFTLHEVAQGDLSPWTYFNGVIHCGNIPKGTVLLEFLATLPKEEQPSFIIFVDDKKHHAHHVDDALAKIGIESLCIHYTHMDDAIKNYDHTLAQQEFLQLLIQHKIIQ